MSDKPPLTPEEQKLVETEWDKTLKVFEKANLHPVCPQVLMLFLAEDMVSWRTDWTTPMVESFWKLMDPTLAEKTHRQAITDLIKIATYVNEKLDRVLLSTGLLVLLNEAVLKWKLVDMDAQGKFEGQDAKAVAAAALGSKDRPVPAKVGEKAPEGSLRPDQLAGAKRRI